MTQDWRQQSERSSQFMLRAIVYIAMHFTRAWARSILYPVVAYFLLTSPASRAASQSYLRRVLPHPPTWRDRWRHFFAFASCTLDRIFFLANRQSDIEVTTHRPDDVAAVAARGKGCLLVMAHFGSFEVMRFMGGQHSLPISILLDRQVGKMLTSLLEQLNPEFAANVIDGSERGPHLVLKLKESLDAGRMVCLSADRAAADETAVVVDFLGSPARFTAVPWMLAGALGVPVILGFGIYRGGNRYDACLELFSERLELPRGKREAAAKEYAQAYARRLEYYARLAPYNWFNFYDFWQ